MTNNQKILASVILIGVVAVAGYFLISKKLSNENTSVNSQTDTSNWKTYTSAKYGFEIKYPPNWFQSLSRNGQDLFLEESDCTECDPGVVFVDSLEQYNKSKLEDIWNGVTLDFKIDFKKDCKTFDFAGVSAYNCNGSIFFYNNNIPFEIGDDLNNEVSRKIISTFKFIK